MLRTGIDIEYTNMVSISMELHANGILSNVEIII